MRIQLYYDPAHFLGGGGGDRLVSQVSRHGLPHAVRREGVCQVKGLWVGCGRCGGGIEEMGKGLLIRVLGLMIREDHQPLGHYSISLGRMCNHSARRLRELCTVAGCKGAWAWAGRA